MIRRPPVELLTVIALLGVGLLGYRWLGNSPWLLVIILPLTGIAMALGARHGSARGAARRRNSDEDR